MGEPEMKLEKSLSANSLYVGPAEEQKA